MNDIATTVAKVVHDNPEKAAQVRADPKNYYWFVGQVMKYLHGHAHPADIKHALKAHGIKEAV